MQMDWLQESASRPALFLKKSPEEGRLSPGTEREPSFFLITHTRHCDSTGPVPTPRMKRTNLLLVPRSGTLNASPVTATPKRRRGRRSNLGFVLLVGGNSLPRMRWRDQQELPQQQQQPNESKDGPPSSPSKRNNNIHSSSRGDGA
jgi:hypothetical protein